MNNRTELVPFSVLVYNDNNWEDVFQGRNVDSLILYFGEDPARCPFEQGTVASQY